MPAFFTEKELSHTTLLQCINGCLILLRCLIIRGRGEAE